MQGVKIAAAAAVGLLAAMCASGANASTIILGTSFAAHCSDAANATAKANEGGRGRAPVRPGPSGIEVCDRALADQLLSLRDKAATHVNRGVLRVGAMDLEGAQADFDRAIELQPQLAEAYVNRGGVMIARRRFREGVEEITRGLAMNPVRPEKAYFNRAIGYEGLEDLQHAYVDYRKAAELAPEWPAPQEEMARFVVRPAKP